MSTCTKGKLHLRKKRKGMFLGFVLFELFSVLESLSGSKHSCVLKNLSNKHFSEGK